jgi:protocatechuate 3,4-dioxygenase beta subunit
MERKDFLKNGFGFLGMALVSPSILALDNNGSGACVATRSETEGPFPTKVPANFLKENIIDNRTGIPFTIEIEFKNTKQNCNPAWGLIVDIWHCDKDGYYSEYGGAGNPFQTKDMTKEHFLRGRQVTDPNGIVKYTSIFPGWYDGRSTHIHVHVYSSKGKSLLITQIAFPEGSNSAVEQVNASAANGYTKGMNGYTYNAQDGEFKDGVSDEMSVVTGSVATGYKLTHTIYLPVDFVTGVDDVDPETQFKLGANYPNPVTNETTIPITLLRPSDVTIEILDLQGRKIYELQKTNMNHGLQKVPINVGALNLASGRYIYTVEIRNENGTFKQSKMMVKAAE